MLLVNNVQVFRCFHLPSNGREARALSYECYLCGKFVNKEPLVVAVLDQPIDPQAISNYLREFKTCIADVFGYRSDLSVEAMLSEDKLLLRTPEGRMFATNLKYVRSVTVLQYVQV